MKPKKTQTAGIKHLFTSSFFILYLVFTLTATAQEQEVLNAKIPRSVMRDYDFGNYLLKPVRQIENSADNISFEAGFFTKLKLMNVGRTSYKRSELDILMQLTLRMYNEFSSPIYPLNFEPGFRFSHHLKRRNPSFKEMLTFEVRHLSNGQSGDFYIKGTNDVNIKDGDFSTNYMAGYYSKTKQWKKGFTFYYQFGARVEWGIPGTFLEISESLVDNYGALRLLANLQIESPVFTLFGNKEDPNKAKFRLIGRVENVIILGNLSNYTHLDKHRYNFKTRLYLMPVSGVRIGGFLEIYNGRDYYNLRFTEDLERLSIGIVYNFNRN